MINNNHDYKIIKIIYESYKCSYNEKKFGILLKYQIINIL